MEQSDLTIDGDLNQISAQRRFLSVEGFNFKVVGVFPVVAAENVKEVLTRIWRFKVDGWWHYKERYIQNGVCTEEQYNETLQEV
jgi:hypothetical protein